MVHIIEVSDDELRLLQAALDAYRDDFGHREIDVWERAEALIAKLPPADGEASIGD